MTVSLKQPNGDAPESAAVETPADGRRDGCDDDWREMPFVEFGEAGERNYWSPAQADLSAQQTLGEDYARWLIAYLRKWHGIVDTDDLINVAREMVKRGPEKFGHVEIGFFYSLGEFIASGKIRTGDWMATLDSPPAAEDAGA